MMLMCSVETVVIYCDGLPYGACNNTRGIQYVDKVPLCPEHLPAPETGENDRG